MPGVGDRWGQTFPQRPTHSGVGGPVKFGAKNPVRRTRCLDDLVSEFRLFGNRQETHPISGDLHTVIKEFSRRAGAASVCQALAQKRASTTRTGADYVNK